MSRKVKQNLCIIAIGIIGVTFGQSLFSGSVGIKPYLGTGLAEQLAQRGHQAFESRLRQQELAAACANGVISAYAVDRWMRLDEHTIVLYQGSHPVALVRIWGFVYPSSQVRVSDALIRAGGFIEVDGVMQTIREAIAL